MRRKICRCKVKVAKVAENSLIMASKSDASSKDIEHSYFGTPSDRSISGELIVLTYIVIWTGSLASPIIIPTLLYNGYLRTSLFLITFVLIAYSPKSFDQFLYSNKIRSTFHSAFAKYFENISLGWVNGRKPYTQKSINDANNTDAIPTLFCVHPHGIFSQSWGWIFCGAEFMETTFMFSNALYISPFFRLLCRICGHPSGCDKKTMLKLMKWRKNLALITGGFHEASIHCSLKDRVYIKKRRGFVKYAIQNGYSLTPIYGFGEKDTFYNAQGSWKWRLWLNDFGIPAIVPFGRWFCPILPRNQRLHVVVGDPLRPPKLGKDGIVTEQMIEEHHRKYVDKLCALYKKYSKVYYGGEHELEVW